MSEAAVAEKQPVTNNVTRFTKTSSDGTVILDSFFNNKTKRLTGRLVKNFLDGSSLTSTVDDGYGSLLLNACACRPCKSVEDLDPFLKDALIGETIEKWPNGKTKSIYTLGKDEDDLLDLDSKITVGFYVDYYEDGTIKRVGDTRSGEEYTYTSDGKPQTHTIGFGGQILDKVEWTDANTVKISVYDIYNRERLCEEFDQNEKLLKTTRYNKEHEPVRGNFKRFIHCIAFNTDDVCEKIRPVMPDEAMRLIQQTPDI